MTKRTTVDTIRKILDGICGWKGAYCSLCATIFLSYWIFNRRYTGPAYLSDEIGYLTKAAAFAGYRVDMPTSWHGGYSLMLAPLFRALSEPFAIWQGIMALNAAIWATTFALLFHLLRHLFSDRSVWSILWGMAFCAAYPAWITMSGYAFATPGFALVFMISLIALTKLPPTRGVSSRSFAFSGLVGFLYWIHPTGLAVAAASVLVMGIWAWVRRDGFGFAIHCLIVAIMIGAYQSIVHPWLDIIMTPAGQRPWRHYPEPIAILTSLAHVKVFLAVVVIILGQLSYFLVSSFGTVLIGLQAAWARISMLFQGSQRSSEAEPSWLLPIFCAVSVIGIICLAAITFAESFSSKGWLRVDQWIYGRYAEMALLPLLAIGLVSSWRKRYFALSAILLLFTSLVFLAYVDATKISDFNNKINIPSFWPVPIFPDAGYPRWFLLGIGGVIAAGLLGKRFLPLVALPLFAVTIGDQVSWHSNILSGYSNPTNLVSFVRHNFPPDSCIGFDTRSAIGRIRESRNLYSFYFYDYDFRRMSPNEWIETCDGPFITFFGKEIAKDSRILPIGRVASRGLYVLVKKHLAGKLQMPPEIGDPTAAYPDVYWDFSGQNPCVLNGCFHLTAEELIRYSQVGVLISGRLASSGKEGFLFFGPYIPLAEGSYLIEIKGRFTTTDGATLDVVSSKGNKEHLWLSLDTYRLDNTKSLKAAFSLAGPVNDVEVRLYTTPSSRIEIEEISVRALPKDNLSGTK